MQQNNRLLDKFLCGEPSIGTFTHLKSSVAIEAMGYTGLDYVVLDMEHSPTDMEFLTTGITAADAAGITPLVRISDISRSAVLRPLDLGAKGLIVPAVETAEQVRRLVEYAKFAPVGNRGFCPTRDGGWGFAENAVDGPASYMENANRQALLLPQCETDGCLEHIEEIAAMNGVDGIFVGPLDLSISLGCPMDLSHPKMLGALDKVLAACKKNNKLAVIFCSSAEAARSYLSSGFHSVTIGLDASFLMQSYRTLIHDIQS